MKTRYVKAAAAAIAAAVCAIGADAQVTFSGSSGLLSASAEFSVTGAGDLVVELTNTSAADILVPADVLAGVFFNISGAPLSLGRDSALLTPGSLVYFDPDGQPVGGVVGGEYAYRDGLIGAPGNRAYGISSSGFSLFGPSDLFPGPDLAPPTSPDGLQYGMLSAGDDTSTGNSGILGSGGLIKNSVTFTLSGAGIGFDLGRIESVWFQYGTDLSEPGFEGNVPAPAGAALLGFAGLLAARRRRGQEHPSA
jgi:MYXO-CTERM domain-containing protein